MPLYELLQLIKGGRKLSPKQRSQYKTDIQILKDDAKVMNAALTPYVNKDYYCGTCGSKSGHSHPESSFCFICDTDNWVLTRPES